MDVLFYIFGSVDFLLLFISIVVDFSIKRIGNQKSIYRDIQYCLGFIICLSAAFNIFDDFACQLLSILLLSVPVMAISFLLLMYLRTCALGNKPL